MIHLFTIFIIIFSIRIHLRKFNGDQNALPSWLYPKKYFNESLLSNFLFDNAIPLISTSLISTGFLFL